MLFTLVTHGGVVGCSAEAGQVADDAQDDAQVADEARKHCCHLPRRPPPPVLSTLPSCLSAFLGLPQLYCLDANDPAYDFACFLHTRASSR